MIYYMDQLISAGSVKKRHIQNIIMDNLEKYRDEYVTDVTYTMNYKMELNPLNVQFNFL